MLLLAEANHRSRIIILPYYASHPVTSAQIPNIKCICYALLKPPFHVFKQKKDLILLSGVYAVTSELLPGNSTDCAWLFFFFFFFFPFLSLG